MDLKLRIKDFDYKEIELIRAFIDANKEDGIDFELLVENGSLKYWGNEIEIIEE